MILITTYIYSFPSINDGKWAFLFLQEKVFVSRIILSLGPELKKG